jgi:hypothetical protein
MSDYYIANPVIGAPGPVTATHTSPQYPIGLKVVAVDRAQASSGGYAAGEFVYARGSNMASGGQFVQLINGSAVLLASANSTLRYQVGVAPVALTATNVYGWVQVQGKADYVRAAATDASVPTAGVGMYLCATNGALVPTAGIGSCVVGVHCPVSNASGTSISASHVYYLDGACKVHGVTASN